MADTPSLITALIKFEAPPKNSRASFATAMQKMGFTSVFDIVRLPKAAFARQLARYSDANADLAYDNAMGYAALIARLYREYKTSSGTVQQLAQRNGLRALVPSGPTFQAQFKENWDEYCEGGAIADATGPVAYLSALRIFASQLEDTSTDTMRLLMDKRRPDLKDLLITHESTFTPRPMLDIVNDVLERQLRAWLDRNPADKVRSIHEVLADRRYPFELPYNFYHHQCRLGLDDKKPQLGELNYLASLLLPIKQAAANDYGQIQQLPSQAQRLLCGLSPQQQQLLIERSVFSDFYLTRSDLIDGWQSPLTAYLRPHTTLTRCYLLLSGQADIVTVTPLADTPTDTDGAKTAVSLTFRNDAGTQLASIDLSSNVSAPPGTGWLVNRLHAAGNFIIAHFKATSLPTPTEPGFTARCELITVTGTAAEPVLLARQRFALTLDDRYSLTSTEQDFLRRSYGIQATSDSTVWQLTLMSHFMHRTGLNAKQVEQLVARRRFEVRVSPSCPDLQPARNVGAQRRTDKVSEFSYPDRYGACYVNGTGPGTELYEREQETSPEKVLHDDSDNAIGLEQTASADSTQWRLTKVSLDRLDRLQRMARLHRWTGISFAHLDTLVISAIRAEGETNLGMEFNENTLRALGVYRFLNHHYSIEPEQFAALMHDLSPYASGKDQVPLLDQVFNRVQLFDTPLILDQSVIDLASGDAATLKTVLQLCAGLKVQPTEDSFLLIAAQTNDHLGSLRRDLPTISSLYRQTLVAQLFGHSVAEVLTLAKLLGGKAFLTALVGGRLSARTEKPAPDILDVLMILHWAFDWLKQSQQTVDRLQQRLGPPALLRADTPEDARRTRLTEETLSDDLRARLVKLQGDTRQNLITREQVAALGLPPRNGDSGGEINWFKLLDDHDLISSEGLIAGLDKPLTLMDEPIGWLETGVASLLEHLILQPEVKAACAAKLIELLLRAHDHQSQLLEGLFQETAQLPADRCKAVIHWAHSSIYSILLAALEDTLEVELIEHFQRVSRHAQIIVELRLSNSALRAFVVNPAWLGGAQYTDSNSEPALCDLYLLERFSHWFHSQSQPEDSLLSYFTCANPPKVQLKNKALRQLASETANAALACLLEWSEAEISTLTDILPDKRASSMAHVDWVRRCQAACQASGLSATALLQATDLTDTSSLEDWKAVGQAVMATHSAAAAAMAND
ncbi:hypothetical protein J3P75_10460 [Pseudomonas sp. R1-1]